MIEESIELICITLFLLAIGGTVPLKTKDTPNCIPDYRPNFKCFVFEKLP